ncbi:MAG: SufD family Fe-S cluster assembly protein [Bacteroidales bacterium]|nr:SufD family Fe-S cluster assembly protein [Bacteroidales bacterium]
MKDYGHYIEVPIPQDAYVVGAGESLDLTFAVLPGESKDTTVQVFLTGEGASVRLRGLYLCPANERVRFHIEVHHRAPGCTSDQLFKGIVGGSAHTAFDGRIIVAPDAQQTEAYQANHNLLLSAEAKAETKPQLEIYADDVKCSHGATIGQLNEEEQFYMRSRGIPASEAKVLQMISFVSEVIAQIPDPAQREDLSVLAEAAIRQMV